MTFDEFKELKPGDYSGKCRSYEDLVRTFTDQILIQVDDDDYQGDSRLLVTDAQGRFGILIFGWGSCSGCDAYQACYCSEDYWDLRNRLKDSTRWFDTSLECLRFFDNHDWEGNFYGHQSETIKFVKMGQDYFAELILLGECDEN